MTLSLNSACSSLHNLPMVMTKTISIPNLINNMLHMEPDANFDKRKTLTKVKRQLEIACVGDCLKENWSSVACNDIVRWAKVRDVNHRESSYKWSNENWFGNPAYKYRNLI